MAGDTNFNVHDIIWRFSVADPRLHSKGFTVYKVTCKAISVQTLETLTEIVCWKRYNDFKTLYSSLQAVHKTHDRTDHFPAFAKPQLFGRFSESVIEKRRESALELLNFISSQPHLYKSVVFKQFLEDGRVQSDFNKRGSLLTSRSSSMNIIAAGLKANRSLKTNQVPAHKDTSAYRELGHGEYITESENTEKAKDDIPGNDAPRINREKLMILEGTWRFPQEADNISLGSSTDDEITDHPVDNESLLMSSLLSCDLASFEPRSQTSTVTVMGESVGSITKCSSWLLEGLNMLAVMEPASACDLVQGGSQSTSASATELSDKLKTTILNKEPRVMSASGTISSHTTAATNCIITLPDDESKDLEHADTTMQLSRSSGSSKTECGKGDLDLSEWQIISSSLLSMSLAGNSESQVVNKRNDMLGTVHQRTAFGSTTSVSSTRTSSMESVLTSDCQKAADKASAQKLLRHAQKILPSEISTSQKPRSVTEHSVSSMDLGGKEDYIYVAADQISRAHSSEANGDYEVAFAYYKSSIGILLHGVQGDTNKSRRDAVRRKTAQYLMKAEDLFNKHLADTTVHDLRWGTDSFLSPSLDLDPSFTFIRGSAKELRSLQVLGTIDRVILVRDKNTDETFVVKSIAKSTLSTRNAHSILPTSCPYMVSLYKLFETDDSIFLLLQYASGGKLWTYIADYLNRERNTVSNWDIVKCGSESEIVACNDNTNSSSDCDLQEQTQSYSNSAAFMFSVIEEEFSSHSCASREQANVSNKNDGQVTAQSIHSQDTFNDSDLSSVPTFGCKAKTANRRFSSLSDDYTHDNDQDNSVLSQISVLDEESFSSTLLKIQVGSNAFSIRSVDSSEMHNSSSINVQDGSEIFHNRSTNVHDSSEIHNSKSTNVHDGSEILHNKSTNIHDSSEIFHIRSTNAEDSSEIHNSRSINVQDSSDIHDRFINVHDGSGIHNSCFISVEDTLEILHNRYTNVLDNPGTLNYSSTNVQKTEECFSTHLASSQADGICLCVSTEETTFPTFSGSQVNLTPVDDALSQVFTPASNESQVSQESTPASSRSQAKLTPVDDALSQVYTPASNENQAQLTPVDDALSQAPVNSSAFTFSSDGIIQKKQTLTEVDKALAQTDSRASEVDNKLNNGGSTPLVKLYSCVSLDNADNQNIIPNGVPSRKASSETMHTNHPQSFVDNKHSCHSVLINGENLSDYSQDSPVFINDKAETNKWKNSLSNSCIIEAENIEIIPKLSPKSDGKKHHFQTKTYSSGTMQTSTTRKLSTNRMSFKEMTRSASFECDIRSPARNRTRAASGYFEQLDFTLVDVAQIPESCIKKWMAQLVTAVSRLHTLGVVCRDLKPANVLLGDGGQLHLTYFYSLGHGNQDLDWDAKENLYAAPEVGSVYECDRSCDWWSVGALLYELAVGRSLIECHPGGINSHTHLHVPTFVSDETRGLLQGLLRHNPHERLGSGMAGSEEIKSHPYFVGVDWHALEYS